MRSVVKQSHVHGDHTIAYYITTPESFVTNNCGGAFDITKNILLAGHAQSDAGSF